MLNLSQLEERVMKIEAALREVRADGVSQKDDHFNSRYGNKQSSDDLYSFKVYYVAYHQAN